MPMYMSISQWLYTGDNDNGEFRNGWVIMRAIDYHATIKKKKFPIPPTIPEWNHAIKSTQTPIKIWFIIHETQL